MERVTRFSLRYCFPLFCLLCQASVPLNTSQFLVLDRLARLIGPPSQTARAALELLELVAKGRTDEIPAGSETLVGLAPAQLHQPAYAQASVRAYALRKIGEANTHEALDFLQNLKQADLAPDSGLQVWPAAQVALRNALLNKIVDPHSKIEFLEATLTEPHDAISNSAIGHWAVEQLCDRGSMGSIPAIQRSLRYMWTGARGEEEIAYCEARIQILSSNPDRAKALGSILRMDNAEVSDRLTRWAIFQLDSMNSPTADAELDRFSNEMGKLREGSPAYARYWEFKEMIRAHREARAQNRR